MISSEVTRRLCEHAGLVESPAGIASISSSTAPMSSGDDLNHAVDDFLDVLEALNRELNGETPSEGVAAATSLPREVVYAFAEADRQLRDYAAQQIDPDRKRAVTNYAWRLDTAWLAVLAGDVDDLRQHLSDEEIARSTE